MTKHSWVLVVLLLFFLLIPLAIAVPDGTGIITVNGTNVSGAQSNVTVVDTNNTYSVTAWNVGNGIKTFTIHVFNSSDTLTFNLYNNTPGMIYELRVNGTAKQGYQADSLGLVTFRYVQPNGNRSYDLRPATVIGGQNFTWSWFKDIIIKNGTIENVWMTNVTQVNVNVTVLNATEITGNGSRISGINGTNITFGEIPEGRISGNYLKGDNNTVVKTSNDSLLLRQKVDSCTGASDALGWNNTGFNCKTISTGGSSSLGNGSIETTYSNTSRYFNASTFQNTTLNPAILKKYNLYYIYNRSINGTVNLSWMQYRDAGTTGKTYTVLKQNGVNASAVFDTEADNNYYGFSAVVFVNSTTRQTIELWGWRTGNSHIIISGVDIKFDHVEEQQKETTGIWNG